MRVLAVLVTALLPALAAESAAGGPYAVRVRPTEATVAWVVEQSGGLQARHKTLTNLKPGAVTKYEAGGVQAGFKTPPQGRAAYRFVVFGDTRTRADMHRRVVSAILKASPDFVIHTGDLVANGASVAQWREFFDIENELLRRAAFFPVPGNHERNDRQYFDFFVMTKPYYSFDWGQAHFTMLDTDFGAAGGEGFWKEQARWLDGDLAGSAGADFRFVIMHHPPITAIKRRQGNQNLLRLVPILEKHKVTAVFAGHDHNYQRHLKNGIQYIVTGGGGAPLYDLDEGIPGVTQKLEKTEHFVAVRVDGKDARIEALALDGRVLDTAGLEAK